MPFTVTTTKKVRGELAQIWLDARTSSASRTPQTPSTII